MMRANFYAASCSMFAMITTANNWGQPLVKANLALS